MPTQTLIKRYVIVLDIGPRGGPGPTTLSGCGGYRSERVSWELKLGHASVWVT